MHYITAITSVKRGLQMIAVIYMLLLVVGIKISDKKTIIQLTMIEQYSQNYLSVSFFDTVPPKIRPIKK